MRPNDPRFSSLLAEINSLVAGVEGQLTPREITCLAWLAAHPTTTGEVLEIGTFKGRSTIVLARAQRHAGTGKIVAVDPLTSPSITDPALAPGESSGWTQLQTNLRQAGVDDSVEFHQRFSTDLAREWPADRKLRLLWIDGDHTYQGAKTDFELFRPFLAEGALVAMHDVLHHHGGPARVFSEDILLSPHFGAAGFCGSIGWSQFHSDSTTAANWRAHKLDLYRRLTRVISYTAFGTDIEGTRKVGYKLARARIPHGDFDPEAYVRDVRSLVRT